MEEESLNCPIGVIISKKYTFLKTSFVYTLGHLLSLGIVGVGGAPGLGGVRHVKGEARHPFLVQRQRHGRGRGGVHRERDTFNPDRS